MSSSRSELSPAKSKSARHHTPAGESPAELQRRAREISKRLRKAYPGATCALHHENPLQLLVATILSAQCTDARVNMVTPKLFTRFPKAKDLAEADRSELEELIRSTGFFRNKAKAIQGAADRMEKEFSGQVPRSMDELLSLPGVARKTANVVLGTAYGIAEGFVVDTHVYRLSHRMGLAKGTSPEQVERELMELFPRKDWVDLGHILIHHGRAICVARNPKCPECVVDAHCPKIGVVAKTESKAPPKPRRPLKERILSARSKR